MSYRPEGWEEWCINKVYNALSPEIYSREEADIARKFMVKGIEAGADAMLEGLKKNRIHSLSAEKIVSEIAEICKDIEHTTTGWLVFIPEEAR